MSSGFSLPSQKATATKNSWHGMAFIMEAIVLIVILAISTALLVSFLNEARIYSEKGHSTSFAVILATNEAERFYADPPSEATEYFALVDGALKATNAEDKNCFKVKRTVKSEPQKAGTLYLGEISVEQTGDIVYTLKVSRYLSEGGV